MFVIFFKFATCPIRLECVFFFPCFLAVCFFTVLFIWLLFCFCFCCCYVIVVVYSGLVWMTSFCLCVVSAHEKSVRGVAIDGLTMEVYTGAADHTLKVIYTYLTLFSTTFGFHVSILSFCLLLFMILQST